MPYLYDNTSIYIYICIYIYRCLTNAVIHFKLHQTYLNKKTRDQGRSPFFTCSTTFNTKFGCIGRIESTEHDEHTRGICAMSCEVLTISHTMVRVSTRTLQHPGFTKYTATSSCSRSQCPTVLTTIQTEEPCPNVLNPVRVASQSASQGYW